MIKETILDFTWTMIGCLAIIFTIVKLILIRVFKIDEGLLHTYFSTLRNADIYQIEQAETDNVKRFLKLSNRINTVFYMIGASILLLYLLFTYML